MKMMPVSAEQTIAAAFDTHSGALLLYARQWVGAAAAEDVVQRVFLKLIAGHRVPEDFRSWLFRCVRNEAISESRSSKRRDRREQSAHSNPMFLPSPNDLFDAADAQRALTSLPPNLREVVTLRIWSELTFAEISAVTDTPLSTVYDHYKSALAELRQKLEPSCRTQ